MREEIVSSVCEAAARDLERTPAPGSILRAVTYRVKSLNVDDILALVALGVRSNFSIHVGHTLHDRDGFSEYTVVWLFNERPCVS